MGSVFPCLRQQAHSLRPDAVQGEECIEIRGQIPKAAIVGVDEGTCSGPADPDAVEDGAAVLGVGHPPRISNASSSGLSDALR